MFVCTTKTVGALACCSYENYNSWGLGGGNPGWPISPDRRMIDDLRRVDLTLPPAQYYKATSPSPGEIDRMIVKLKDRNPNALVVLTMEIFQPLLDRCI